MSIDLKPCPFCGGKPSYDPAACEIDCMNCGAVGGMSMDCDGAYAAWNTRHNITEREENSQNEEKSPEYSRAVTHQPVQMTIQALKSAYYWMGKTPRSTQHNFERDKQRIKEALAQHGHVFGAAEHDMEGEMNTDASSPDDSRPPKRESKTHRTLEEHQAAMSKEIEGGAS